MSSAAMYLPGKDAASWVLFRCQVKLDNTEREFFWSLFCEAACFCVLCDMEHRDMADDS